ncbi:MULTISPECIES: ribosomal protein S18-alanine N-acetyltransferase [unclassified Gemella]|uniref:ribosomal protein S18-alanine N-acetyltransferase n=1 Tax=unclassified Gemella TaxID=2624949 RepID=UPI0010735D4E|nr:MULTISPECIES: ribosomal protein S18-alanine N-acetyltransferase [unclassified Gemella]MBF0709665.1 ribosomal protein S18-alanine N-acetyltransferase [Gemella sp. GL1.1]MBF0746916.1 ribosomal protein S18-alanine N-acetyltransferase [Gemella sp. 19428wG2_WT2a]NYS27009.1 ribosomal protein S18-alanine N-acetyltransferase [Gemella sp. GL1]TFU59142.1 ribosomal-protein-alanine N-acetyltransferase [Gemella sp. WT2a]
MIKIDKVGVEYLDILSVIDRENFVDPWSKEMFKKELEQENSEYYAIFNGEEVLGFCGGWYVLEEYQINKIVIDKKYQNKKMGSLFLLYMMQLYANKGAKRAIIEVRKSNKAAIKVYERVGFELIGKREKYYQNNGEDALIMIRNFENES